MIITNGNMSDAIIIQIKGQKTLFSLDSIKQNGIAPDSPLLWALIDYTHIAKNSNNDWIGFTMEGSTCEILISSDFSGWIMADANQDECIGGEILNIKIDYQGSWADSLTKRPEGC